MGGPFIHLAVNCECFINNCPMYPLVQQGFHPVMIDTIRVENYNPSPLRKGLVNGILQKGKGAYAFFAQCGRIIRSSVDRYISTTPPMTMTAGGVTPAADARSPMSVRVPTVSR